MQFDLNQFRNTFFEEAAEHVAEFEAALLGLEKEPGNQELLNSVFRDAHSIKGGAGMFGLEDVARFTHTLESLLDRMRAGGIQVSGERVALLLRAGDVLRELLAGAQAGSPTPERMNEIMAALVAEQRAPQSEAEPARIRMSDYAASEAAVRGFAIHFRPSPEVFRQGMDPLLVLRDMARLGELTEVVAHLDTLPPLGSLEPSTCYLAWSMRLATDRSADEIREVFLFVDDGAEITIEAQVAAVQSVSRASALPAPAAAKDAASIRVSTVKVDKLIDLVGELVIAQSMASDILQKFSVSRLGELQEAFAETQRYTRELQERVMSVRMLPVGTVFSRFPRLVHDVAAQLGKQVELRIVGEETELDKRVVERMSDPLTHLIRNAVDHGIESPEDRRRAGKPEQGVIRLEAFHQAGSVVIEVADDGGGLDVERVRRKAQERGLMPQDSGLWTEQRIRELIFLPGFSTAEQVTGLSGRGVGMDVVKQNVEALNGSVNLSSSAGQGTCFRIKIPLTLAILDGLLLRVGSETYVLPLVAIVESIRPRQDQLRTLAGDAECVLVRGEPLPLLRLHRVFGIASGISDPCQGLTVILEHAGKRLALLVDELLGQQQVVIKSLETHFRKVEGALGATILGDGRAALILDVAGLASAAERSSTEKLVA
jgi:two-component system chemotaxis sensor kinase CheA